MKHQRGLATLLAALTAHGVDVTIGPAVEHRKNYQPGEIVQTTFGHQANNQVHLGLYFKIDPSKDISAINVPRASPESAKELNPRTYSTALFAAYQLWSAQLKPTIKYDG